MLKLFPSALRLSVRNTACAAASVLALQAAHAQPPAGYPAAPNCSATYNAANLNSVAGLDLLGTYNGHTYYITEGFYYGKDIASTAAAIGALFPAGSQVYAAAIVNKAENDWIACNVLAYNGFKYGAVAPPVASSLLYQNPQPGAKSSFENWGDVRNPWIGYTDNQTISTEGQFVWSNGQPKCENYENWNVLEPNNYTGQPNVSNGEDFTQMLIMQPYQYNYPGGFPNSFLNDPLGRWNDWFNERIVPLGGGDLGDSKLPIIIEVGPKDCGETTGNQGCSPGYWKNHTEVWPATGYSPGAKANTVFTFPGTLAAVGNKTLLASLDGGGGPGVVGGATILMRQAVAALLNAAHPGVNYPLTVAQIISQVNTALASNNKNTMTTLAGTLDGYNNLHGASLCGGTDLTSRGAAPLLPTAAAEARAFAVSGYPNPSRNAFSLRIDGAAEQNVTLRVTDATGRLVEQRSNVPANQVLQLGATYQPGLYHVEVMQNGQRKQVKLVKQ